MKQCLPLQNTVYSGIFHPILFSNILAATQWSDFYDQIVSLEPQMDHNPLSGKSVVSWLRHVCSVTDF